MRTNRPTFLAAALTVTALLGACGSDGDGDDAAEAERPALSAPAEPAAAEVLIERSRFEPDELTVPVGTEVRFENLDAAAHTVTSAEGSALAFDSGELAQNEVFTQVFDAEGTYDYFCEIHPTMRSTVVVG